MIDSETDIGELVNSTSPAIGGNPAVPETYLFSKELVAYLKTLIAYCCYYRADDSRMAGKMEQFYTLALALVSATRTTSKQTFTSTLLGSWAWYKLFPFPAAKRQVESDCDEVV